MLNSLVGQQSAGNPSLNLEQLLRAAKLIEQRAIVEKLVAGQQNGLQSGNVFAEVSKLGEDYQERAIALKIRSAFGQPVGNTMLDKTPNSTGSSRRSSPLSASSSAPTSPDTTNKHIGPMNFGMPSLSIATTSANVPRASSSASSTPSNNGSSGRRVSGSRQSRAAHNELEKNRRANLRGHLEALKSVLPLETDSHRDTTLSLLTRARNHIRFIKDQKTSLAEKRAALLAEHLRLREQLHHNGGVHTGAIQMPAPETVLPLPAPKPVFSAPTMTVFSLEEEMMQISEPERVDKEEAKIDVDFLAMNGLMPALPLLYPYSYSVSIPTPAGTPMNQF